MRLRLFLRNLADVLLGPPVEHWVLRHTQGRVAAGPFAGMHYVRQAIGSSYLPKVLGTYEKELQDVVRKLSALDFRTVIDIGAAEGYYAVGFARMFPRAEVFAFELEQSGQALIQQLATENSVQDRVHILGRCELAELGRVLHNRDRVLVLCDVEGDERELLELSAVPALATAYLICETHDFLVPDVTAALKHRFACTHAVKTIAAVPRRPADLAVRMPGWLRMFGGQAIRWCLGERRGPGMKWLICEPRSAISPLEAVTRG